MGLLRSIQFGLTWIYLAQANRISGFGYPSESFGFGVPPVRAPKPKATHCTSLEPDLPGFRLAGQGHLPPGTQVLRKLQFWVASHAKTNGFSKWRQVGPGLHVQTDGLSKWWRGGLQPIFILFEGLIFEACFIRRKCPV